MSHRFIEWIAQRAAEDNIRLEVFILAALAVLVYVGVSLWPAKWRPWGKAFIIESGAVVYVVFLAFSFFTLGISLGLGR